MHETKISKHLPRNELFCTVDINPQLNLVKTFSVPHLGTLVRSSFRNVPASNKRTFHFGISDNLFAITQPVGPAPTMMKSNCPKSEKKIYIPFN